MGGVVTGLEWSALTAMIPEEADRERVLGHLREWETGMLAGTAEKATKGKN